MIKPKLPVDEVTRIETLRELKLLDSSPEERFDRLTRLAKRMFNVPIALVTLVDVNRQWFKSSVGLDASETPRDISFCGHAILGDDVFLVPDATLDERFHDNPLVVGDPYIRFYAGCPLNASNGTKLGTLCIIDSDPRDFDDDDLAILRDLARMAEQEMSAVQLATMDELTRLSNRRGFITLGQHALTVCRRLSRTTSLLYFDLNDFKEVNDTYGHAEGDYALTSFAALLQGTFRECDVLGRLGGDEFAVLLTDGDEKANEAGIKRLERAVACHNMSTQQRGYNITFSVGSVQLDSARHETIEALIADADERMYADKRAGKNSEAGPASE